MNRKKFIRSLLFLPFIGKVFGSCRAEKTIKGKIIGPDVRSGHLLRGTPVLNNSSPLQKQVVIIGGGISGLSAARKLHKSGIKDFVLLELEPSAGGNSAYGSNSISEFPLGAHYIPVPNPNMKELMEVLREAGCITGFDESGVPTYSDLHLCADPEERLYINGRWQEGLIPDYGVPDDEKNEIQRFLRHMDQFRYAKGRDNKDAFAIPINDSSIDEEFTRLDNITMKHWLVGNQFNSNYLHEYVNYCTRDDFGTNYTKVSAWAGIHYFASRKGYGTNAAHGDVLTWPAGNGFLVRQLKKGISEHIKTGCLVTRINMSEDGVIIHCLDIGKKESLSFKAAQCIVAVPQFIASRLLNDEKRIDLARHHFSYAPWMVANVTANKLDERSGEAACWDNVIAGSQSLGYVSATHQLLNTYVLKKNLTYYLPLTAASPAEERALALARTHGEWVEFILKDLQKVHPNIRKATEEINITLWGHAMIQPVPGFISGLERRKMSESINGMIHFAHTDLSGISIFEEAFYQGISAAKKVLNQKKRDL